MDEKRGHEEAVARVRRTKDECVAREGVDLADGETATMTGRDDGESAIVRGARIQVGRKATMRWRRSSGASV